MTDNPVEIGWLRLFVDIVRHGSLSGAARSHGLSQPAVSYQVRQLEARFGVPLLSRQHRGVAPTLEGKKLFEIAAKTVSDLDDLATRCRAKVRRPILRLVTDYAFSTLWLIPRMHSLRRLYPEFDIQIGTAQRLETDWSEAADIAVAFGSRSQFALTGEMMMPERVVPICSPGLLDSLDAEETGAFLPAAPLIHLDTSSSSPWFNWQSYLAESGVHHQTRAARGDVSFNNYAMVVQAALGGQGLALGWLGLVDTIAESGMLIPVGPELIAPDRGYWVLTSKAPHPNARRLADWLMSESASSAQAQRGLEEQALQAGA
ncbi:MAG TPA: LysR family transcriptional regulator [Pseudorhizobium sp.]|nr:LysR family transcriptional regulator [Pseudorhizobium sp.]